MEESRATESQPQMVVNETHHRNVASAAIPLAVPRTSGSGVPRASPSSSCRCGWCRVQHRMIRSRVRRCSPQGSQRFHQIQRTHSTRHIIHAQSSKQLARVCAMKYGVCESEGRIRSARTSRPLCGATRHSVQGARAWTLDVRWVCAYVRVGLRSLGSVVASFARVSAISFLGSLLKQRMSPACRGPDLRLAACCRGG